MTAIEIIDRRTVPAEGAQSRLKLFMPTEIRGDEVFAELTGPEGAGLSVTRDRPLEFTVIRSDRAWQSLEAAFEAGREVAEEYGFVACEPDVEVAVMPADPGREIDRRPEESADELTAWCWAPEEADLRQRKRWAIAAIKADKAWAWTKARGLPTGGEGIVIAQPDTGITTHIELAGIPLREPRNLLGGGRPANDPTDPMQSGANPGHGTGTASVVVSREASDIIGSAPAATLMPIRAIERVAQPSMVKVAEAVDHAVEAGAHVITMSLGGIWSYSLWAAIERAVAADIIVMAAAGNCVGVVVWPAQFDACLGIAGVDQHFAPWKGTSKGPEVDISAPGQNVYRANATLNNVGQGQGTSFAVALTAGVAACWLARHGRANLIAAARQRGETVQEMFRRLVKATAQRPSGWDEMAMGAGVVDAEALMKAGFDLGQETEGPVRPRRTPDATSSLRAITADRLGAAAFDPRIDWTRRGAEISLGLIRHTISPETLPRHMETPPVIRAQGPHITTGKIRRLRDQIVAGQAVASGASLESMQIFESTSNEPLTLPAAQAVMDRVTDRILAETRARPDQAAKDRQAVQRAIAMLREHGSVAMRKLVGTDGPDSTGFNRDDRAVLEAIVIADGTRPSFLIEDGAPPTTHPFMGAWGATIAPLQAELARLASAVGRIQPGNGHNGNFIGTGCLVDAAKGLILTNYHVLDDAMQKFLVPTQRVNDTRIRILGDMEIDFIGEASSFATRRFRIVEANLHPTSGRGFGRLDAVTMKIEPFGDESVMPEVAIRFSPHALDFNGAAGRNLCTIGFPGPPVEEQGPSGRVNWEFVLKTLFGDVFGVKRLAPGRVILVPGQIERDSIKIVFGHDATIFKGASGSPVFAWGVDSQPAIGLHFAGDIEVSNYALTSSIVAEQFRTLGVPL